jgi:hypothetical protein
MLFARARVEPSFWLSMDDVRTLSAMSLMDEIWLIGLLEKFPVDNPLIQGTALPRLLLTSQEHKLAWMAQIRLARLAYATVQEEDTPTNADTEANETTHTPWTLPRGYNLHCFRAPSIITFTIITTQQEQAITLHSSYHSPHGHRIRMSDCSTPHDNRKTAPRTAGSGCKPVTLTRQSAIRHRSRETESMMRMLTT